METEVSAADLRRDIALQDAASLHSSTIAIRGRIELHAVVPGLRRYEPAAPADRARLLELAAELEWSYGYLAAGADGRVRRAAPSAGALYPTEALLVARADGAWRLLFYDFERHGFLERGPAGGDGLARELDLADGAAAVFLVSVLWRTLQGYGLRGYRYCLIDAANVASNLVEVLADCGLEATTIAPNRCALVEAAFGLPAGLPVVLGLRRPGGPRGALPERAPVAPPPPRQRFSEDVPAFNPQVRRVLQVVSRGRRQAARSELQPLSQTRGARAPLQWAQARHSAADFTPTTLAPAAGEALLAFSAGYLARDAAAHGSSLAVAFVRAADQHALAEDYLMLDAQGRVPARLAAADRRREAVAGSFFQGQLPAAHAALLAVIGVPELEARGATYGDFEQACLRAGFFVADLYRFAALHGIGTTAIGGFSDRAVSALLGAPAFHPLIVQAFGSERAGAPKLDAVFAGVVRVAAPARSHREGNA